MKEDYKNVVCVPVEALVSDGVEEPSIGDNVEAVLTGKITKSEDGVIYVKIETVGGEPVMDSEASGVQPKDVEKSSKDMSEEEMEEYLKKASNMEMSGGEEEKE